MPQSQLNCMTRDALFITCPNTITVYWRLYRIVVQINNLQNQNRPSWWPPERVCVPVSYSETIRTDIPFTKAYIPRFQLILVWGPFRFEDIWLCYAVYLRTLFDHFHIHQFDVLWYIVCPSITVTKWLLMLYGWYHKKSFKNLLGMLGGTNQNLVKQIG